MSTTSSATTAVPIAHRRGAGAESGERVLVAVPAGAGRRLEAAGAIPDGAGRLNIRRTALAGVDFAAVAAAAAVAWYGAHVGPAPNGVGNWLLAFAVMPFAWLAAVAMHRGYDECAVNGLRDVIERPVRAFGHVVVLLAVISYATHADLARAFLVIALPLAFLLDVTGRCAVRGLLRRRQGGQVGASAVLAVGSGAAVTSFADAVRADPRARVLLRGACLTAGAAAESVVPAVGDLDCVAEAARLIGADTVAVLSATEIGAERLRWIAWQLEGTGIDLLVSPGLGEITGRRLRVHSVAWLPLLHVEPPQFRGVRRVVKEAMDRTLALVSLLLLLPVFAALFLLVRLSSPGPAIFRQTRVGRDGKTFKMLKFRSMCADAESRLPELAAQNVYHAGPLFKVSDDPRVTRVGRVLRHYSLDELPQLLNVVRGDMSLVGPRPPLPAEVLQYEADARRRLLVKPGITGLWQVSGRNDLSWSDSVRLDLRYVENWSPSLDLMILWKTASAVLRGSGAY